MKYSFVHNNINVFDLERSLQFYSDALNLQVVRRKEAPDGSFIICYLSDGSTDHQLELTWLRDKKTPYNLGDNEIHIALRTDDFDAAYSKHKKMGCICYENTAFGLYFIEDPDGYWLEILPPRK